MNLVVIGNGIAGVTSALGVRERDASAKISLVGAESDYFFSRTALMYAFMERLSRRELEPYERGHWDEKRIERIRGWVVDHDAAAREIVLDDGRRLPYDKLVLALGARPRKGNWHGTQDVRDGVVHFVSMQDLDACERLTQSSREAVVVGGGLIGIELVESLRYHNLNVTFLVREPHYWPVALGAHEASLVADEMRRHGVNVVFGEELDRVQVDTTGRVESVVTKSGKSFSCQMLGVTVGVEPNIERMTAWKDAPASHRGIIVNEKLETSISGVFACGDCAEIRRPGHAELVELIWYSAKRQGAIVAANILGDERVYEPPIHFNSSKFFELEYTTVGDVMTAPVGSPSIALRDPRRAVCARIVHDGVRVLGFNLLGSRWDNELLTQWIEERRDAEWVFGHLRDAQFDGEFGRAHVENFLREDLPITRVM